MEKSSFESSGTPHTKHRMNMEGIFFDIDLLGILLSVHDGNKIKNRC